MLMLSGDATEWTDSLCRTTIGVPVVSSMAGISIKFSSVTDPFCQNPPKTTVGFEAS